MTREEFSRLTRKYMETSDANKLQPESEGSEGYVGLRFFEDFTYSIGRADDPRFSELKALVGEHHTMPDFWLPGAKTVISVFFRLTEDIRASNVPDIETTSRKWLFGRLEGDMFLMAYGRYMSSVFESEGLHAVVPLNDERLIMEFAPPKPTSNWSERHTSVITGLGTFGLHGCLITDIGSAGYIVGLITDWDIEPDGRVFSDFRENCLKCGACFSRCSPGALSPSGKELPPCQAFLHKNAHRYTPRYGCGKCLVGVPCEASKPVSK